ADVLSGQDDSLARCIRESLRHWVRHRMRAVAVMAQFAWWPALRAAHYSARRNHNSQIRSHSGPRGDLWSRYWRLHPRLEASHLTMRWGELGTALRPLFRM